MRRLNTIFLILWVLNFLKETLQINMNTVKWILGAFFQKKKKLSIALFILRLLLVVIQLSLRNTMTVGVFTHVK